MNDQIDKTNSYVANISSPNISKKFDGNMNELCYDINADCDCDFNRNDWIKK